MSSLSNRPQLYLFTPESDLASKLETDVEWFELEIEIQIDFEIGPGDNPLWECDYLDSRVIGCRVVNASNARIDPADSGANSAQGVRGNVLPGRIKDAAWDKGPETESPSSVD